MQYTHASFKNGPMLNIGHNAQYAFTREECITHVDQWCLQALQTIDENCLQTYLKDYSRSYYKKEFHMNSIMQYNRDDPDDSQWNNEAWEQAVNHVRMELRQTGVNAASLNILTELDAVPYVSSSAAGYGYQGKKGPFKNKMDKNNHWKAIRIAKKMVLDYHDSNGECINDAIMESTPSIGYTRTQLTDITEKLKVRAVWGSPFHHILVEGLSAAPLLNAFVEGNSFYFIGGDPLVTVPELITETNKKYQWIYTYDWSKFDATATRKEIRQAFTLVKEVITFPNKESENAFDLMVELFIYKKVVGPDGIIYTSNTGIPSGSYWTNLIDSIINKLRIDYLWIILTRKPMESLKTHGDDGLGGSDTFVPLHELAREALKHGWILNPDKSELVSNASDAEFLGRTTTGGLSRRSIDKCLRLLVYPEYPVESPEISSFRAQSIFEDVGRVSEKIGKVANMLLRKYGTPDEQDVPVHHRRFKH
jgi:hypothetical protein